MESEVQDRVASLVNGIGAMWRAACGLAQRFAMQMAEDSVDDLKCDILLFFATQTEREQLKRGAAEFGLPFEERDDARVGIYHNLGTIGPNRVRAIKTRMGPFFHQGSASQAIVLRKASSATSIIQLGMAFGIDRQRQKHGDVLVSRWLFPYDYRIIEHVVGRNGQPDRYEIDYRETKRFHPKQSLLSLFEREFREGKHDRIAPLGGMPQCGSAGACGADQSG